MGGDTVWKAQCVESETDEQIWEITTAAPTPRNPYKATLTVNGTPLTMVIDTGALIPRRPQLSTPLYIRCRANRYCKAS